MRDVDTHTAAYPLAMHGDESGSPPHAIMEDVATPPSTSDGIEVCWGLRPSAAPANLPSLGQQLKLLLTFCRPRTSGLEI